MPSRTRWWSIALTLALALRASALEYAVPTSPRLVSDDALGDVPVTWVDWGAAGTSQRRDAELIVDEHEALRAFLHSPEMKARLIELIRLGEAKEADLVRARMAAWQHEYATREMPTGFARASRVLVDEVPLPMWAWGLPPDIRRSTQVAIFDDRDDAQRAWVLRHGREDGRLTFAFCTGWRSGEDRDRFWRANPGVQVHPVATDQFTVFYGVSAYPALIRFADETMHVEQGLDP